MATNSVQEKWNNPREELDEDEEALSLCDLPLSQNKPTKEEHSHVNEKQEEFNFNSWVGLLSTEPKMCVADEVFFQGQILPSRASFSSQAGLLTTTVSQFQRDDDHDHGKQLNFKFSHCKSKHESFNEFRSNSSTSQNSTTSSSTSSTTTPIVSVSKSKVRNQFHTHPSPKPQLKSSCPRKSISQSRKSSVWEIFRLGVVPTPEIGLQDLKVRRSSSSNKNCVSRNSSSSSSNNSTFNDKSGKMSKKNENGDKSNHVLKHLAGIRGGLLSGCDCSIETVIKSGTKSGYKTENTTKHAVKEKVEWKKQKQRQKQGKKVMSRRRTFEWLKELHASHADEEALLSNSS